MVEMFKDILKKIQSDIEKEKREREQSQEALLNLMEETCGKLIVNESGWVGCARAPYERNSDKYFGA